MRSKRTSTVIILILLLISCVYSIPQDQQIQQKLVQLEKLSGRFSFIVMGDTRDGYVVYPKLISAAMDLKPDFIVNTGDMITRPGNTKQWLNFWEMSKPVTVPYFLTVGNHDVSISRKRSSEKTYKDQVDLPGNELYYSFNAGNSLFVVLDSQLKGQEKRIAGEQLEWLQGVLAGSKQPHKFVFVHHPLYPPQPGTGRHAGNSLDLFRDDRDRLQALFRKYDVTIVFAGHEHLYSRTEVGGIDHVITGGGGAPLYAAESDGGFHHFVHVTVDGEGVRAEVVDANGKVRDRFQTADFGLKVADRGLKEGFEL